MQYVIFTFELPQYKGQPAYRRSRTRSTYTINFTIDFIHPFCFSLPLIFVFSFFYFVTTCTLLLHTIHRHVFTDWVHCCQHRHHRTGSSSCQRPSCRTVPFEYVSTPCPCAIPCFHSPWYFRPSSQTQVPYPSYRPSFQDPS